MPRGRPKKSFSEPTNIVFWKGLMKDNKLQIFLDKGTNSQKLNIKNALIFVRKTDSELFNEIKGNDILNLLSDIVEPQIEGV